MDKYSEGTQRHKLKEWSIMVYMAGGMDVSDEARSCLLDMKRIGSTQKFHLVAQFDSGSESTSTKRYYLEKFKKGEFVERPFRKLQYSPDLLSILLNPARRTLSDIDTLVRTGVLSHKLRDSIKAKLDEPQNVQRLSWDPDWINTLILDSILEDNIEQELGQTNAGDPKRLVEFINWATREYPAKYKMLIIWGHGSGLSVAWDYPPNQQVRGAIKQKIDSLTAAELRSAFEKLVVEKIDLVGFNSCLMGMIEVYHELSHRANYCVASEGLTPKTGWPYYEILQTLEEKASETVPEVFSKMVCDKYIQRCEETVELAQNGYVPGMGLGKGPDLVKAIEAKGPNLAKGPNMAPEEFAERRGMDISVCALANTKPVVTGMKILVSKLQEEFNLNSLNHKRILSEVLAAHSVSQSYFNGDYVDLSDFCKKLQALTSDQEIRDACRQVIRSINGADNRDRLCIYRQSTKKPLQNSFGVSLYFPWGDWGDSKVLERYNGLKFITDTGWGEFLKEYRADINQFQINEGVTKVKAPIPSAA